MTEVSPLATKADVEALRQYMSTEVGTITRELSEHRRQLLDDEELHREVARNQNARTRLWAAAFAAGSVVVVGVIQVVANHSYAIAREQMRETTRQELVAAASAQSAHDEILIKRVLDERDRRFNELVVKGNAK